MSIGEFGQLNNSLEKLEALSRSIQGLKQAVADSNDSSCSDEMMDIIEDFKEQNPDISAEHIAEAIKQAA